MPRRRPLNRLSPKRICLIKPSALGDIVQTLPILAMLRERFPAAHIAWVAKAPLAPILEGHSQLDEVIPLPYPKGAKAKLAALRATMRELRERNFDLTIDLQGLARSGMLTWATRAPRRVGSSLSRELSHLAYTDRIDVGPWHQPALQTLVPIAEALGCRGTPPPAEVPISEQAYDWACTKLEALPRPVVAICQGAQWETKRWPPRSFATLAKNAIRHASAGVVLVGGPDEKDLADETIDFLTAKTSLRGNSRSKALPARESARHFSGENILNLAGETSLPQLAAICQQADVFVSGDSGPLHLAAALNTPTLGIFTCTDPVRSGPRRDLPDQPHRCIATKVDCAASYITKCGKLTCMHELSPLRVWPELQQILDEVTGKRRPKIAG